MAKKSFKSAIDKTPLKSKSGVSAVFSSTEKEAPKKSEPKKSIKTLIEDDEPQDLRQSFIISEDDLETLKDFVYYKKMNEDPFYSQKSAIHEGLKLLFNTVKNIPSRPDAIRKAENKRIASLKRARSLK